MNKYSFDALDEIWDELCAYYQGNAARALIWLSTKNAALDDRAPFEMVQNNEEEILRDFILDTVNMRLN